MKHQLAKAGLTVIVAVTACYTQTSVVLASDGDCSATGSIATCLGAQNGTIDVSGEKRRSQDSATPGTRNNQLSPEGIARAAFCRDATDNAVASGGAPQAVVDICRGFAALPVAPGRGDVLRAFRELGLYRGAIRTDPVAFTLVNLETFFWCGDDAGRGCELVGEGERTVTLLGQPVRIRPRIVGYEWDFGDGAGARVESGKAAHIYERAGTAGVALTLTWTADYAVGGGAFQPIGDTTTTTSPPRTLPVREAEAIIVGDN